MEVVGEEGDQQQNSPKSIAIDPTLLGPVSLGPSFFQVMVPYVVGNQHVAKCQTIFATAGATASCNPLLMSILVKISSDIAMIDARYTPSASAVSSRADCLCSSRQTCHLLLYPIGNRCITDTTKCVFLLNFTNIPSYSRLRSCSFENIACLMLYVAKSIFACSIAHEIRRIPRRFERSVIIDRFFLVAL